MFESSELDNLRKELSYDATTAFQSFQEIEAQLNLLNEQLEQLYQKKPELCMEISELKNALEGTINRVKNELAYLNEIRNLENAHKSGVRAFEIFLEKIYKPTEKY